MHICCFEFYLCQVLQLWMYSVKRTGLSTQLWGAPVLSTEVQDVWLATCEEVQYPIGECGTRAQSVKISKQLNRWDCTKCYKTAAWCSDVPSGGQWIQHLLFICLFWMYSGKKKTVIWGLGQADFSTHFKTVDNTNTTKKIIEKMNKQKDKMWLFGNNSLFQV